MAVSLNCPKCGGSQISSKAHAIDPLSGARSGGNIQKIIGWVLAFFGGFMLIMGIPVSISMKAPAMILLYLFVGGIFLLPGYWLIMKSQKAVLVGQFHCAGCGNEWSRRMDEATAVKCPHCGEMEAVTDKVVADRKTGDKLPSLLAVVLWGVFAVVLIGGGLWMAIITWKEGDDGIIQWEFGSTIAGLGFLGVGIGFGRLGVVIVTNYLQADRAKMHLGNCLACKQEWKQWEGEDQILPITESDSEEDKKETQARD